MRNLIIISVLLLMAGFVLLLTAKQAIEDFAKTYTSFEDRVAECVVKEYEANPDRKAIEEYCKAKVRLE